MSTSTPKLGLVKPAAGEKFSRATYNNNLDIIDTGVLANETLAKGDRKMVLTNAGYLWAGANASWDAGTLVVESASGDFQSQISPSMSFCAPGSVSGSIKFNEPGLYDVVWAVVPSGEPGNAGYRINCIGTWPGLITASVIAQDIHINGQNYWETVVKLIGLRVPTANLEIRLIGAQTNSTTNTAKIHVVQRGKF